MKNKNKQSVGYVMNDRAVIGFEQHVMSPWIDEIIKHGFVGWAECNEAQRIGVSCWATLCLAQPTAYAIRGNRIPAPVRARKRIDAGMTTNRRVGTAVSCPPFHISRGQTIRPFAYPTGLGSLFSQSWELEAEIKKQLAGLKYE